MKRNIKGLVLAVLMFGVQGVLSGHVLAFDSPAKVWVQAAHDESSAFPRSALDD